MRNTFTPTLVLTLLSLALAGIAWAGQAAVDTPEEPVQAASAPEEPLGAGVSIVEDGLDSAAPGELFQRPEEMTDGAKECFIACRNAWRECKNNCPAFGEPGYEACHTACVEDFEDCKAGC